MNPVFLGFQKCIANDKCEMVHLSDKFLKLVEYTHEELEKLFHNEFFRLVLPEDVEYIKSELARQAEQGNDFSLDYRIRSKTGKIWWIHDQGSLAEENGVKYYYSEFTDATSYHKMESHYKNLLNSLPNPVTVTDLDRKIIFMNKAFEELCGLSLSECLGKQCDIFHTNACGTENCCIKRFLRGDSAAVQPTPSGGFNRVSISVLSDSEGKPCGYISVSTDVTELIKTEQRLRVSEERYRIASTQISNVIWEYDFENSVAYRTGAGSDIFHLGHVVEGLPESMIKRGIVAPESEKDLLELFTQIRQGCKYAKSIVKLLVPGGGYRWYKNTFTTIYDDEGKPIRGIGVSMDITAEKDMEQRFKQELLYRNSMISDAIASYEVNLTRDTLLNIGTEWFKMLDVSREEGYNKFVFSAIDQTVSVEHRERVKAVLGRKALLEAFRDGKREVRCEYQRLDASHHMIWVSNMTYLTQSAPGEDVHAFIYIKNIDDSKKNELELKKKAEQDSLTGLYNRVTTLAEINQYLLGEKQDAEICAMFMLDIDNFKLVNDTYGHLFGDEVLSEMARRLRRIFRSVDVLGRLGGDEFIIFMKSIPFEELALKKAAQICQEFQEVYAINKEFCHVSCSVGIAFSPRHGKSFEELYAKADIALYYAKNQGKNCYAMYCDRFGTANFQQAVAGTISMPPVAEKQ